MKPYTGIIGVLVGIGLVSAFMGFPTGNVRANLGYSDNSRITWASLK